MNRSQSVSCDSSGSKDTTKAITNKRKERARQLSLVYQAFHSAPRTMKEVTMITGIIRETVCWRCHTLRSQGRLFFLKMRKCSITGEYVKEWTSNTELIDSVPKQAELF